MPAALGLLLVAVPLVGVVLRVDLARLPELVTSDASRAALGLSLRTSLTTTALCVVLGVPVRYIHAHNGILDLQDLKAALDLVKAMVSRLDSATVAGFTRYLA